MVGYPSDWGELAPSTCPDVKVITRRVVAALDLIEAVSSAAYRMVNASLQVITLVTGSWSAIGPGKPTLSLSSKAMIGRTTLGNAESDIYSIKKIANNLVHEAIHSLIYKLELLTPLYANDEVADSVHAVSPWSGRHLQLHSFVHACFVWFGLWSFWSMEPQSDDESDRLKERALKGFINSSPLSGLTPEAFNGIQPYVRAAIEQLYERVRSAAQEHPLSHLCTTASV
jgi:HEXXH motif-containing protein